MKVGIFHWRFDNVGGGEVLANNIGKSLNSPIHSIISDKTNQFNFIDISSHLSTIVKILRKVRTFDYFTWSSIDVTEFGDFDMIVSTAPSCRALIIPDHIPHVNVCFSPPRWLYDLYHIRRKKMKIGYELVMPFAEAMRIWDSAIDKRVDYYISISPIIKRRLWKYLKRNSDVIYPPIHTSEYKNKTSEGYFLFLSRLEIEKRPEETIQACINTNQNLVVAGTGSLENKLRKKYKKHKNIEFTGFVSDEKKIDLLARCEALVYPNMAEDFGIVPIEALASGKPVISADDGFPPLLIQDKYGVITDGSVNGIGDGINKIIKKEYNPHNLITRSMEFDYSIFKERLNEKLKFYKEDFDTKFKP